MDIDIFNTIEEIKMLVINNKINKYNILRKINRKKQKQRLILLIYKLLFSNFILDYNFLFNLGMLINDLYKNNNNAFKFINYNNYDVIFINEIKYSLEIKLYLNNVIKLQFTNYGDNKYILHSEYIHNLSFKNNIEKEAISNIKLTTYNILCDYINSWDIISKKEKYHA